MRLHGSLATINAVALGRTRARISGFPKRTLTPLHHGRCLMQSIYRDVFVWKVCCIILSILQHHICIARSAGSSLAWHRSSGRNWKHSSCMTLEQDSNPFLLSQQHALDQTAVVVSFPLHDYRCLIQRNIHGSRYGYLPELSHDIGRLLMLA